VMRQRRCSAGERGGAQSATSIEKSLPPPPKATASQTSMAASASINHLIGRTGECLDRIGRRAATSNEDNRPPQGRPSEPPPLQGRR
jgi:hypothetical protein